jgi:hypothetical protein
MILEARRFVAAVHEVDLAREAGEEEGLLGGAVAAADDGDVHLAVKRAVAGGAGGHALAAVELLLTRGSRSCGARRRWR